MNCKLSFICDKKWEELDETGYTRMKYCDKCEEYVFLIKNNKEFEENRKRERCVAFAGDYQFDNKIEQHQLREVVGWPDGKHRRMFRSK